MRILYYLGDYTEPIRGYWQLLTLFLSGVNQVERS